MSYLKKQKDYPLVDALAQHFGVHPLTANDWIKGGWIPTHRVRKFLREQGFIPGDLRKQPQPKNP